MKKIIIACLMGILIVSSSYAQTKRKYTDTAVVVDPEMPQLNGLNTFFKDGWKFKSAIPQVVSTGQKTTATERGWILVILTKPINSKENESN